jgi:ABC-type multidrug transport system fused ATPase/permease subunit
MNIAKKIRNILTSVERIAGIKLLGFMVIGMVLETLGVGLIIPALTLLTQQNTAAKYPTIQHTLQLLGNPTQTQLVIGGMLALVMMYIVKTSFIAYLAFRQTGFAYSVQARLSQQLFTTYLSQSYTFHLQRNTAQLMQNSIDEVNVFTHYAMLPGIILLTEVLVLIGLSSLMLMVEPLGAFIVMIVMGTASFAFYRSTRIRVARWGAARQFHEGLRIQHIQQGLGAVKDVKLLGREKNFLELYQVHNSESARVARLQSALQLLPRLWLELLAVMGMALLVIVMIMQGRDMASIVPTLGLFAIAAFRLMPSVNRVLGALNSLRYGFPVINRLNEELKLIAQQVVVQDANRVAFENEITLTNINFTYPGAQMPAVQGVSIKIPKGATIGFVGPSGSGKSTLIDVILGLHIPLAGQVRVDGKDTLHNMRHWQDQIGYVPQTIYLTDDTLRNNIAFGIAGEQIDDEAVQRAVVSAQLEEFINSLPDKLDTLVGERGVRLSGGQRQRIGIARALYHDPSVLVLDEATSALDTDTESGVMRAVSALHGSKTILIVAHRLSTLQDCDTIYRMENGLIESSGSYIDIVAKYSATSEDLKEVLNA